MIPKLDVEYPRLTSDTHAHYVSLHAMNVESRNASPWVSDDDGDSWNALCKIYESNYNIKYISEGGEKKTKHMQASIKCTFKGKPLEIVNWPVRFKYAIGIILHSEMVMQ